MTKGRIIKCRMNIMSNVTKGRKTKRKITEDLKLQKVEKLNSNVTKG